MKREKNGGWGSLISKHSTILGHKLNAQLEDRFLTTHDPSRIMDFYATLSKFPEKQASHIHCGRVNVNLRQVLISTHKYPHFYSSSTVTNNMTIDSGALVCISPYKSDFITYGPSGMKIKDLSSTNKVAGKGLIQWDLQDKNGHTVTIEAFGYHIPAAKVCLLSPQVIIDEKGGHAMMTEEGIDMKLDDCIGIFGKYCQRSNLPLGSMAQVKRKFSF
jgi:hypothetical protein